MRKTVNRLMRDERGTSSIEYALIASLIAVVIVGTLIVVGQELNGMFNSVTNGF